MMKSTNFSELKGCRHAHLSQIDPAWSSVASKQKEADLMAEKALNLPINEFRALGYRPPPLPEDAPLPGIDINITVDEISINSGTKIRVRTIDQFVHPQMLCYFSMFTVEVLCYIRQLSIFNEITNIIW
jgi:hypothetical protein